MSNTIWVLVELENGQPARSSLEVLGKAAQLGRAEAIVLGFKCRGGCLHTWRIRCSESLRRMRMLPTIHI